MKPITKSIKKEAAPIEPENGMEQHLASIKGELVPPTGLDSRRFAGRWAKVGPQTQKARRPEYVNGKLEAEAWQVYRNKNGKPHTVTLGSGKYVYLIRPKKVQQRLNALFGNISRQRLLNEKQGHTIAGQPNVDGGMLDEKTLEVFTRERNEDESELARIFNKVEPLQDAETTAFAR